MPLPIRLEQLRNVRHEGVIRVGISKEGADAQKYLADGECWGPLVLQNIQANPSIRVDVAVVDACGKVHLGRLEGIIGREVNIKEEDSASIRRVIGTHDGCLPVEHVITDRSRRAVSRRVLAQVHQLWRRTRKRSGNGK